MAGASYAASWLQPRQTLAQADQLSEIQLLNQWNNRSSAPSLKLLQSSLSSLGYKGSLHAAYEVSQNHIEAGIRERCARLAPDVIGQDRAEATWEIEKAVRENFRWQRFLSKGRLKQHAADFVQAVAKSTLPFVQYEVARIADRKDPFARRIFLTSLCDNRTRMHLQEFRLSRAYFFGTLIRAGRNDDGSLRMYPCLLKIAVENFVIFFVSLLEIIVLFAKPLQKQQTTTCVETF